MPSVTTQHLAHLYESFAGDEVTFNSPVILASGLLPADIHLKIADVHVGISLGMTVTFLAVCLAIVWWIFKTGYRLKV